MTEVDNGAFSPRAGWSSMPKANRSCQFLMTAAGQKRSSASTTPVARFTPESEHNAFISLKHDDAPCPVLGADRIHRPRSATR
jgi:hypothetical protein